MILEFNIKIEPVKLESQADAGNFFQVELKSLKLEFHIAERKEGIQTE